MTARPNEEGLAVTPTRPNDIQGLATALTCYNTQGKYPGFGYVCSARQTGMEFTRRGSRNINSYHTSRVTSRVIWSSHR